MKALTTNNHGFSLLEMLGTMFLFSIFLALTFPYLKASSTLMKNIKAEENFELVSERVFQTISEATNITYSFFAINSFIIHPDGIMKTLDHKEAFAPQLARYPVAKGNRPLSFMQIMKKRPINVISSNINGESAQFIGCMLTAEAGDIKYQFYDDQHWLLLSFDGTSTMQGRMIAIKAKNICAIGRPVRLDLTLNDNPVFGSLRVPPADNSTFIIYPIENEFSLYLDQKGVLRKLFHRTMANQRLVQNIESLKITSLEQGQTGSIIKIVVSYKNQDKMKIFSSGSAASLSPLDLLL